MQLNVNGCIMPRTLSRRHAKRCCGGGGEGGGVSAEGEREAAHQQAAAAAAIRCNCVVLPVGFVYLFSRDGIILIVNIMVRSILFIVALMLICFSFFNVREYLTTF